MGSYCGKEREEGRMLTQHRSWSKTYITLLKLELGSQEQELWYSETVKLARTWDKPTSIYSRKERWVQFRRFSEDSQLRYLVLRRSSNSVRIANLFDMLNADFFDQSNPIAGLISTFTQHYLKVLAADCKNKDARGTLKRVVVTLLKYVEVLVACVSVLYSFIDIQLASSRRDLEGLLLAHLVNGDLYRLIEDLTITSQEICLKKDHLKPPVLAEFTSSAEILGREAEELIKTFVTSENLFEKVRLMEELDVLFERVPAGSRIGLAAYAVVRAKAIQLPANLEITQFFYPSAPPLLVQAQTLLLTSEYSYTSRFFLALLESCTAAAIDI